MCRVRRPLPPAPQRGMAAVEFALIAVVFFMLLLGAIEIARVLWVWNAAGEATRYGARMAVVCDLNDSAIKTRMRERLAGLGSANITLAYLPAGCAVSTCQSVTVTLSGLTENTLIPFVNFAPTLPAFRTTLSRESLGSANNPACS